MVTDQQVVVLRQKLMEGKTLQAAASSAAMSERSARKWRRGALPSEKTRNVRDWRTRPDPFEDVWESDVEPLLRSDPEGELSASTILEWLDERHPGRFGRSQLRTLQRRIRDYRALHGPDREVYFQQDHPPGREAQVDFTHCSELGVTIGGEPFRHLLFHLVLSHSGWSYAQVCFGETFAALVKGLQGALWELGGVPKVVRTDNLSAATHELRDSRGRALNARYEAVLAHYGVESTRTNPRSSHENGVVEQGHRRLKNAIDQALILRGSRDFDSEQEYRQFVIGHRPAQQAGELEVAARTSSPAAAAFGADTRVCQLHRESAQVEHDQSGEPDVLGTVAADRHGSWRSAVCRPHRGVLQGSPGREHGAGARAGEAQIDYRHIIGSLVRKPGAFARCRFREQMFPTQTFRLAYDSLRGWRGERADVEYVRILHLAATTMESEVDGALGTLLESGRSFDYAMVRRLSAPAPPPMPELKLPGAVNLGVYDGLLVGGAR